MARPPASFVGFLMIAIAVCAHTCAPEAHVTPAFDTYVERTNREINFLIDSRESQNVVSPRREKESLISPRIGATFNANRVCSNEEAVWQRCACKVIVNRATAVYYKHGFLDYNDCTVRPQSYNSSHRCKYFFGARLAEITQPNNHTSFIFSLTYFFLRAIQLFTPLNTPAYFVVACLRAQSYRVIIPLDQHDRTIVPSA